MEAVESSASRHAVLAGLNAKSRQPLVSITLASYSGHKAHGYVQTADVFRLGNSSFPSSACRKRKLEVLDGAYALCAINAHEKFPVAQGVTIDV